MSFFRWLIIPGLLLAAAGCNNDDADGPVIVPENASAGSRPTAENLARLTTPDPNKFPTGPDTRKAKGTTAAEKPKDAGDAADSKVAAVTKPADPKSDAEAKPATDSKADDDKKPGDSKGGDDKKAADGKKDEAPDSPRDLMLKAREALEKDDTAKAISLLEKVVAIDPKHHDALLHLAIINQREAGPPMSGPSSPYFLKSAAWIRQLRAASPKLDENEQRLFSMFVYNEACTYAVQGEKEKAIKSLEESTESGLVPIDQIKMDEELESLRKLPGYIALMKKLDEQVAELARKNADAAREHARTTLAENKPFKFSFSLPNLDGKKVSLADFKGKVVIVDVWGTWCPPCKQEIPHFVELHKKYHGKGLEIIGINYENLPDDDAKKTIKEFVEKNKVPYTCVLGDEETQQLIPKFEGFPTTLFIDRAGKVRAKTVGFEESMAVELETIVTILLDEAEPKGP